MYVLHDVENSPWERYVGHPITGADVPEPLSFPGFAHPDACPDCAANPELGRRVHAADAAVNDALDVLQAFFEGEVPRALLLKLYMSAWITQQTKMQEYLQHG